MRGQVDGRAADAFENARHIVGAEHSLGLFVEPAVHRWAEARGWIADAASWMYVNSHFTVTTVTLAFLYLRRNARFYFVRNMFMVAMGIALVGYVAFPTAPPRFCPSGASRTRSRSSPASTRSPRRARQPVRRRAVDARRVRADAGRLDGGDRAPPLGSRAVVAYPAVVTFVVIATANHWWFDASLGAATAAVSAVAAQALLARARPDAWAWRARPAPERARH